MQNTAWIRLKSQQIQQARKKKTNKKNPQKNPPQLVGILWSKSQL